MFDKAGYWLELCDDDLRAAQAMLKSKNLLWTGFICHLVAEKALKAVIANITNEVPPKIHNLPRLAALAGIYEELSDTQFALLKRLTSLQIEARYPEHKEMMSKTLTLKVCESIMKETEDFLCWIKKKLEK